MRNLLLLLLSIFYTVGNAQTFHSELSVINNTATITLLYSGNWKSKGELRTIIESELSKKRGLALASSSDSVLNFTIQNYSLNRKGYKNTFAGQDDCIDNGMYAGVMIVVRDNEYDVIIRNINFMAKLKFQSDKFRETNCSFEHMVLAPGNIILPAKKSPNRYNLAGIVITNMYDLFSLSIHPKE